MFLLSHHLFFRHIREYLWQNWESRLLTHQPSICGLTAHEPQCPTNALKQISLADVLHFNNGFVRIEWYLLLWVFHVPMCCKLILAHRLSWLPSTELLVWVAHRPVMFVHNPNFRLPLVRYHPSYLNDAYPSAQSDQENETQIIYR